MHPIRTMKRFLLNRPPFGVMLNRAAGLLAFSLVAVVLVDLFTPSPSQATLPVLDYAAVSQMLVQTAQFTQHLSLMAEQIAQLKQQVQSLTGHYGLGALGSPVNGWGSGSWEDIVNMIHTGVNPGDAAQVAAYKAARAGIVTQFPPLDASLQTSNPRLSALFGTTYQAGVAGMSAGEGTFNSLNAQLTELQALKDKIEKTPTLKAAVDLNTAVAVKNAQINAEVLRTNAMQLYLAGNTQNAVTSGQSAQAEFFAN